MKTIDNKLELGSEQILSISADAPEKLFSGDVQTAKTEYYILSRRWHPDLSKHPDAALVFQHVNKIYRTAQELIETDAWRGAGVLELPIAKSSEVFKSRQLRYFKRASFELGDLYIGKTEIAWAVERQYADLFENARRQLKNFRFANAAMQTEIERSLPLRPEYFVTRERLIMVLPKSADAILLEDLLDYLGGAIPAKHVAWIVGSLQNLCCYFDYHQIVHQDISPRTVFVSPEHHTAVLLGGWWYTSFANEKIRALPSRTTRTAPADVLRNKRADARVDLELIRQTGRELLGSKTNARLTVDKNVPPAMARWLSGATSGLAVTDYQLWQNVLAMDFGKPRFCPLAINSSAIYREPPF